MPCWCVRNSDGDRAFDLLPAFRRQAFGELDALNGALKDALDRPSEGARLAAHKAAARAATQLDRLAADDAPLVLSYTPRFVPPRRATGELTLAPNAPMPRLGPRRRAALRLDTPGGPAANQAVQAVPRYAPDFAAAGDDDPPLQIEIVGSHLASAGGPPPVLSIGAWRGQATVAPERLRFSVPRAAFATDARRTSFAAAALSIRRGSRTVLFQLLFTVLPDRPGSFAFDQRMRTTTLGIQHPGVARDPVACARGRDPHGPPLFRSAGRLALRQGASARGHRRAAGLAG